MGSPLADILKAAPPMPLDGGGIDAKLASKVAALDFDSLFPATAKSDRSAARACLAGLWLRVNDLDASHRISQEIDSREGSFWHAKMHRREGDYGNSKYWLRRVGRHPVLDAIGPDYEPFAFVDRVQACVERGGDDANRLRALQQREWETLFEYCWRRARGLD
jgi:hypothetical protein